VIRHAVDVMISHTTNKAAWGGVPPYQIRANWSGFWNYRTFMSEKANKLGVTVLSAGECFSPET